MPHKKSHKVVFLLTLAGLVAVFAMASVVAQSYSVDWYKVDSGAGTSTGGVYSVTGSIGQPDASATPMSGGNYSVVGGFWSFAAAIQTPGAPLLTVKATGASIVTISWPSPSTGYILQVNQDLNTANWNTVSTTPTDNG